MDPSGLSVVSRRFLNVRSDAAFSGVVDAAVLDSGAILLLPVHCDLRGCSSWTKGQDVPLLNLLELACQDDEDGRLVCEEVAGKLAAALGWTWRWDDEADAPPGQTA